MLLFSIKHCSSALSMVSSVSFSRTIRRLFFSPQKLSKIHCHSLKEDIKIKGPFDNNDLLSLNTFFFSFGKHLPLLKCNFRFLCYTFYRLVKRITESLTLDSGASIFSFILQRLSFLFWQSDILSSYNCLFIISFRVPI